ncbi:MAG: NADH-quinone oxidoreductase subunit D, partial [Ktedonobacteraceae bacterium]|nr:NADH-quinone oxidoreductase subunit D [Ktedonobacteraceae bacterium]
MNIGGVLHDFPKGWFSACTTFLDQLEKNIAELEQLISGNEIFLARTQGVGFIDAQQAVAYGLTGPILRASGVNWDLRAHRPYMAYREVPVHVQVRQEGDCYARYKIRIQEMLES